MPSRTRWVAAAVGIAGLAVVGWGLVREFRPRPAEVAGPVAPDEAPERVPGPVAADAAVASDIQKLSTPEGKIKYHGWMNPGGPWFVDSEPMKRLAKQGSAIQPLLIEQLQNPNVRNEVVLLLGKIGDRDALPHLIELLPKAEKLTEDERFTRTCLLHALSRLTGLHLGYDSKYGMVKPDLWARWHAWYEENKDYLYTPPTPRRTTSNRLRDGVLLDFEAKLAARPTAVYRRDHPWILYEEIKTWRDDAAYEQKLKDYCFSLILNLEDIRSLGLIRDSRALAALHAMCALADTSTGDRELLWALDEKGDPSSVPFLERLPPTKGVKRAEDPNESLRVSVIERIQLLKKYGTELKGKPFDAEHQMDFMRCLDGSKGVEQLISNLRNRKYDVFLSSYLLVAGFVDREPVRACLKEMARDDARDERARTMVHGALARLGEKDSLNHLKKALAHEQPGVRLAAAEGLWRVGNRDGFKALVGILDVRPIESGGEGVRVGDGAPLIEVKALRDPNVEFIRSACTILGEMGERSAIEPLKRLLPLNLNGVLGSGGSGSGWSGRPDAVALAKLGDFSGIPVLRRAISEGDRLGVVDSRGGGDFVEIGLKRFIPELLPLLDDRDGSKRVSAARAIILLLEQGH